MTGAKLNEVQWFVVRRVSFELTFFVCLWGDAVCLSTPDPELSGVASDLGDFCVIHFVLLLPIFISGFFENGDFRCALRLFTAPDLLSRAAHMEVSPCNKFVYAHFMVISFCIRPSWVSPEV